MTRYDLVVIGAGTAGITASIAAAGIGARVLLTEAARPGGECLWTGCVPSKALITTARRAHDMRAADRVGLEAVDPEVDLTRVMARVHEVIAAIEPHDSPARLREQGVEVVLASARFAGPGRIAVDGRHVRCRAALIATGSHPAMPPVPGLAGDQVLTSDNLWDLRELPARLVVLGGGPVGCELGQAFARLGSHVTIVEMRQHLLPGADPEAGGLVADVLRGEGVDVVTATTALSASGRELVVRRVTGEQQRLSFDRLLVATGRRPRTDGLGLEHVGVDTDADGFVHVDETLRTTGRNVFAAGDVTGKLPFTHVAGAHGAVVAANALFGLRRTVDLERMPWAVFTDPEIAQAGLTEALAGERWGGDAVTVARFGYGEVDRAVTGGHTTGFAKLVAGPKGRIVGATVVGESAGESIAEIVAWMRNDGRLRHLAQAIHAYPTMSEGPWQAALGDLRARYLSPSVRRWTRPILRVLRWLDRP